MSPGTDALFAIGIAIGFVAGAVLAYAATRRVVERVATLGRAPLIRACATAAALIAFVPASFYAFVVGGNFGGVWAAALLGQWAIAIGIGLGVAIALAICLFGASISGALLGVVASRLLGKRHAA